MPDTLAAGLRPEPEPAPGLLLLRRRAAERHSLLLRTLVLNLAAAGLLAAGLSQGLVLPLFAADTTYQCHLMALVFAGALALCIGRIAQVGRELHEVEDRHFAPGSRAGRFLAQLKGLDGDAARAALTGTFRLRLASGVGDVRHAGSLLVLLGLIGTVVGFIMALGGVDPAEAGDAGAIGPMVAALIEGMGVALNTTLIGSILNIWLTLNARILETGSLRLLTRLIEAAEVPHHA